MANFLDALRARAGNIRTARTGDAFSALNEQFQRLPRNEIKQPVAPVMEAIPAPNMAAVSGFAADPNAPAGVQTLGGPTMGATSVGAPAPAPGMVSVTNADGSKTVRVDDSGMGRDRYKIGGGMGGFPMGMFGHGGGNGFGGFLQGLQLPADMTAAQLLEKLRGMDWRDMRHDMRDARQDWRQGRPTLDAGETPEQFQAEVQAWRAQRPQMGSMLAQSLGGTWARPNGPATGVPSNGNTGIVPPGTPNSTVPAAPVAPAPNPMADPMYLQNFYNSHGYYPGQGG